jgi:hypothetical protein
MVTAKEYRKTERYEEHLVMISGKFIGVILKYRNTKTETFPWQAYKGGTLIGSFFGVRAKGEAIQAILNS